MQGAEALRRAAAHVGLQKGWRRDEEGHFVLLYQRADDLRIERIGMEDDADALHRRQPEAAVNPKEWKKGRMPRILSRPSSMKTWVTWLMLDMMLKCVSITPLGSPVLPLEKITVARWSIGEACALPRCLAPFIAPTRAPERALQQSHRHQPCQQRAQSASR